MRGFQTAFEEYGALYLRLLGMLFDDGNLEKLGGALEAAHTRKGVAGSLGLPPLYQKLEKPERAEAFWGDRKGAGQI